ncbi:STAS domain-containing protein [Roseitranquillus sediminis]|uniref:STAS domain-containing protein n=1 Tax=Roseitranquillus sediminis TaxID=2809051 RepID=UPI001D0C842F|nr:STAS domain-containing protein [Roseitranquillus sediminis]MBM9594386.1 anti-sigma factor antagonist [Roseitranquillus sediminis]
MTTRLSLAVKLDQKAAIALADELRGQRGADLDLDAAASRHIGSLAVQVIVSAARTWAASGHALRLVNVSDACVEQLGLLGFTPEGLVEGATA